MRIAGAVSFEEHSSALSCPGSEELHQEVMQILRLATNVRRKSQCIRFLACRLHLAYYLAQTLTRHRPESQDGNGWTAVSSLSASHLLESSLRPSIGEHAYAESWAPLQRLDLIVIDSPGSLSTGKTSTRAPPHARSSSIGASEALRRCRSHTDAWARWPAPLCCALTVSAWSKGPV